MKALRNTMIEQAKQEAAGLFQEAGDKVEKAKQARKGQEEFHLLMAENRMRHALLALDTAHHHAWMNMQGM